MKPEEFKATCLAIIASGLNETQAMALFLLSDGPKKMGAVAKACRYSTAAATGAMERMENIGYVKRTHDKEDRRVVWVSITPKGRAKLDSLLSGN